MGVFLEKELRVGLAILGASGLLAFHEKLTPAAEAYSIMDMGTNMRCQFVDDMLPQPVLTITNLNIPPSDVAALNIRGITQPNFWAPLAHFNSSSEFNLSPLVLHSGEQYTMILVRRDQGIFVEERVNFATPDCLPFPV